MKTWRHITHGFWGTFLLSCVALVLSYAILSMTLLNQDLTKRWLADSGAYANLRAQLLDSADDATASVVSEPLNKSDIRAALDAAITEEVVRHKSESVVDIVYAWLRGEREAIAFSVSFDDRTDILYATLEERLEDKLAALPTCRSIDEIVAGGSASLTCLPAQADAATLASSAIDTMRTNNYAFSTPITQDDFHFPAEQATQLSRLPDYILWLRWLAIAALVLFVLSSIYLVVRRRSAGLIIVGTSLLVAGVEFIVLRYLLKWGGDRLTPPDDNTQLVILKAFSDVSSGDVSHIVLLLCGPIAIGGVMLIAAGFIWRSLERDNELRRSLVTDEEWAAVPERESDVMPPSDDSPPPVNK